jgi:hypothetical protein
MPRPFLTTRIEEQCSAICYGIAGVRLCTFEGIARTTGKPETLFFIAPAASCRQNVLDFQFPRRQPLRTEAVSATLCCHRADATLNIGSNALFDSRRQGFSQSATDCFTERLSLPHQTFVIDLQHCAVGKLTNGCKIAGRCTKR